MIMKRDAYIFSKQHGNQLEHTLWDRSFAFNFHSSEGYLMLETTGIKEAGQVTKITICQDFLPKHCKLELVEEALANLETFPNNVQLLKTFADYVENSASERKGYLLMSGIKWGLFIACMVADLPLILSLSVCALAISSLCYNNYLEKKLGKWIGENLIEETHHKPANIAQLEANLIALIGNCKTAENMGEAAYKEIQLATTPPASAPPSTPSYFHSFFPLYPSLVTDHQTLNNSKYDDAREYSRSVF